MDDPPSATLLEQLQNAPTFADQASLLLQAIPYIHNPEEIDSLADALKSQADYFLRTQIARSRDYVRLIHYLGELVHNPLYEALSLRAEGNLYGIGEGQFEKAVACYDAAAAIYQAHGQQVDAAKSLVGKIGCLVPLSRYEEALEQGEQVRQVLHEHQQWGLLTGVMENLASAYYHLGQGRTALERLDEAKAICQQTGADVWLPGIELNRALVLHSLGRFDEAVTAAQQAMSLFSQRGETIEVARTQHILAIIYLFIGRFTEALELSDRVLTTFLADQRHYDAIVVQLLTGDCLLQLGRFADVLAVCRDVRPLFTQLGTRREVAKTVLNEAIAFAGLRHYEQAMASFAEAHTLFLAEGNQVWAAIADLEKAAVQSLQGSYAESFQSAQQSIPIFETQGLQIRLAQAQLIAAWAAFHSGNYELVRTFANTVQSIAQDRDVPWLRYQSHYLQGNLAQVSPNPDLALAHYEQGVEQLERLRGRLMVEFQADFLGDKQGIYEAALRLCLTLNQIEQAFDYAERAKSRSLINLIADRLDVRLEARSAKDEPIVAELQQLCDRHNQLVRHLPTTSMPPSPTENITALEEKATRLWHKLLIRNADYARDAALMEVRTEEVRPYLDAQTLLIEYFIAQGELVVFLVTRDGIEARPLAGILPQLRQPARLLNLALKAVPTAPDAQIASLTANAQIHLRQLHQLLLESLPDTAAHYAKWLFVPHGSLLHYLPFHALYDGHSYLIERHEISYLPAASLLHYIRQRRPPGEGVVAFGHSQDGRLPFALQEAKTVAQLLDGHAYLEEEATLSKLQAVASQARLLHLATHGDYNQDNPLFSGLALADGALNTLDVFNLRLQASLVTLSACQTGRSVVKGGDELQGLLRAFLYAGAQSLLLGLWRVADGATLHFMERFYHSLAQGMTKGEALRRAQRLFIGSDGPESRYRHPYYWAPFMLVGDSGRL